MNSEKNAKRRIQLIMERGQHIFDRTWERVVVF